MMRIVFSFINWDMFNYVNIKTTTIYGHSEVYRIILEYEKAVEIIEGLEEGEYLQDEIIGNVPIKQNKKQEKKVNHLQQISDDHIDYDIQIISITSKNESKKWKQIEEDYLDFTGKKLSGSSDPRNKRSKDVTYILNGSMGGKHKGKYVEANVLSGWMDGLSWYSNYAIIPGKYKYIRLYLGYKKLTDPTKYTVYLRTVELDENVNVDNLVKKYDESGTKTRT